MAKPIEYSTNEEIRQQYFKRFKAFLRRVKKCLPDYLEMFHSTSYFTVTDLTGTYQTEVATICRKNVPAPDNFVADIIPFGVINSRAEGFLEISGVSGEERFVYSCRTVNSQIRCRIGSPYLISQQFGSDGWYWIEPSVNYCVTPVDCDQLLDLIDKVSSGEFDEDEW